MSHWIWIRHAPLQHRIQGFCGVTDTDADITDIKPFTLRGGHVITSPLKRCLQTAQALNLVPDSICPDIREQHFGTFEGQPYPGPNHAFWQNPATYQPVQGESFTQVCTRVADLITRTTKQENIVCIAHAGTIRAALAYALDLSPHVALSFEIKHLCATSMQCIENHWIIKGVNIPLDDCRW